MKQEFAQEPRSVLSNKPLHQAQAVPMDELSMEVLQLLQARLPPLPPAHGYISKAELLQLVKDSLDEQLRRATDGLSPTERQVLEAARASVLQAKLPEHEEALSRGQRMADTISRFGGSWVFIGAFFAFLAAWIGLNIVSIVSPFDPYPFILLNLVLSTLAAIQAPIIMMSQNRKEEKDRLRSINDYKINLQAELEIRDLQVKLDRTLALLEAMQSE